MFFSNTHCVSKRIVYIYIYVHVSDFSFDIHPCFSNSGEHSIFSAGFNILNKLCFGRIIALSQLVRHLQYIVCLPHQQLTWFWRWLFFAFELKGMYFVTWVSYVKTCIRYIYHELFLLLFFEALGWKSSWYQPPRATNTCNAEGPQYHQRNLQVEELLAKSLSFGKSIQWPLGATYSLARAKTL